MKITEDKWNYIVKYYYEIMKSTKHCSIASVSKDGEPNVTPIGSLILTANNSGYYFDTFTRTLSDNIDSNNQICLLLMNTEKFFWLKALFKNKFSKPSGLKLTGTAGNKRKATPGEIKTFTDAIKPLKRFKGYNTLWNNLEYVREINFSEYYPINTGEMTFDL